MLADSALRGQLADVKAAEETRALEKFYGVLSEDPDKARYGFASVSAANGLLAVDSLLVTDKLFKAADVHQRRR